MKKLTAENTAESNRLTFGITRGETLILCSKVAISASPNVKFVIGTIRNGQEASQGLLISGEGKVTSTYG